MFMTMERIIRIGVRVFWSVLFVWAILFFTTDAKAGNLDLRASGELQYRYFGGAVAILGQEHRLHLKNADLHETLTNLGVYYRLTGWLTTGAVYRMAFAEDDDEWKVEHRPYLDLSLTARKLFYVDIMWRPRLEYRIRGGKLRVRVRKKLKVKFKRMPAKPFVAAEVFLPFTGPPERTRVFVGIEPLTGLSTFYLLETDFDDVTEYKSIVGIDYKFSL